MDQIKTSTIRAISPNGQWNGMDKHLVTMADGIQYTFFVQSGTPFPKKLNEEVQFSITNQQYNNAKFVGKAPSNYKPRNNYQGNQTNQPSTNKDDLIVRQTVIKSACELHARSANIDLVLQDAENLYNWIYRK